MSEAEPERKGLTRRGALKAGAAAAGGVAIAGGLLGSALEVAASPAVVGPGPYGPMQSADANGMLLPHGFTSRIIARTGQDLGPRPYDFHVAPDGMGTFKTDDGGFILVSNSESVVGGAGAIRFDSSFQSAMDLDDPFVTPFDYVPYLSLAFAYRPEAASAPIVFG